MEANLLRQRLLELADESYRKFHSGLIPNGLPVLGVRMPLLRQMAKEIAQGDWQSYLAQAAQDYHEEVLLQGLVIGAVKTDWPVKLKLIEGFLPQISNWAVCDSFVSSLKVISKHQQEILPLLETCLASPKEFEQRFALVTYMTYFLQPDYLAKIFQICDGLTHQGYYVKMAAAWLLSVCYAKYPTETYAYLSNCRLDGETFRMTLQKIRDSHRVTAAEKERLRQLPPVRK